VAGIVVRQSLRLAALGIIAGAVLAAGASLMFSSVLVVVNTFDWVGYAGGAAVVLASCLAASYAPSVRAARVDPITTLKHE
jgi:putative ABC transport system permease protein